MNVALRIQTVRRARGFTLIELMVVMAVIGLLLSIVAPRYFNSVHRAEEAVLREHLWVLRDAIDKHAGDTGKYPDSLDDLVTRRYIRSVPVDPLTRSSTTWVLVAAPDEREGKVVDIRSGAEGSATDGSAYAQW